MKIKDKHPAQVAVAMLSRSICSVQVGAVLCDSHGIYAWGWNGVGSGFGLHAEAHCLHRSNRKRWSESTLFVAALRKKSGNIITARPCEECQKLIKKVGMVMYRDSDDSWRSL